MLRAEPVELRGILIVALERGGATNLHPAIFHIGRDRSSVLEREADITLLGRKELAWPGQGIGLAVRHQVRTREPYRHPELAHPCRRSFVGPQVGLRDDRSAPTPHNQLSRLWLRGPEI